MLLKRKNHFNCYEFYSPRGYLLDFNDYELVDFFTQELKKYLKSKKAYIFRVDPYLIYKERDIDGNIVEGGKDNSMIVDHLLKLGFKKIPTKDIEQVSWMFSLDLDGKTEEDILKEMSPSTRNTIRKAEKFGITLKELSYEELPKFQSILEETGKRKDFSVRKLDYFQTMYKLFSDKKEVKFLIAELNLKDYIEKLTNDLKKKKEKLDNSTKISQGEKENIEREITSLEKRIEEAKEIKDNVNKDVINLSASMFILIKPEVIYLAGGNYEEYMRYNAQYLLQWELIKYGLNNGFKKYNFYGIPANINEHPKDYGVYEFKRRFGGYVEELIGEFALPISWQYYLFKLIKKIKR